MPCSEKRARLLLARGRARVHRLAPMVIRLTDREQVECDLQPLRLKLDPGRKATGLAAGGRTKRNRTQLQAPSGRAAYFSRLTRTPAIGHERRAQVSQKFPGSRAGMHRCCRGPGQFFHRYRRTKLQLFLPIFH